MSQAGSTLRDTLKEFALRKRVVNDNTNPSAGHRCHVAGLATQNVIANRFKGVIRRERPDK
jgi:hypothetical protein